jgi:hypothetical protein
MDINKYYERLKAIKYPDKPKRPTPLSPSDTTPNCFRLFADELEVYTVAKANWLLEHKKCARKEMDIYDEFKLEVFKQLGIEDNPKKELFYSKAWELGHSSGLSDVWNYATDLVELIK